MRYPLRLSRLKSAVNHFDATGLTLVRIWESALKLTQAFQAIGDLNICRKKGHTCTERRLSSLSRWNSATNPHPNPHIWIKNDNIGLKLPLKKLIVPIGRANISTRKAKRFDQKSKCFPQKAILPFFILEDKKNHLQRKCEI